MTLLRATVLLCALVEAGWMAFDGTQALVSGRLVTPKSGAHAGQLGPWRHAVTFIGINPDGRAMQVVFAVYGWVWLGMAVAFAFRVTGSWTPMLLLAAGALWYLPIGTVFSVIQVVVLLMFRSHFR